jgi:hypothetical protein
MTDIKPFRVNAALETPELLVADLRQFLRGLR